MNGYQQTISENEEFLEKYGHDLQANIFSTRKKDHVLYLFLSYKRDHGTDSMVELLNKIAKINTGNITWFNDLYLTSFRDQLNFESRSARDGSMFFNLFLTANGLKKLGYTEGNWGNIINHLEKNNEDLKNHSCDPEEQGAGAGEENKLNLDGIDAVFLLAHQKEEALIKTHRFLNTEIFPHIDIQCEHVEKGTVIRDAINGNRKGLVVEHFGYADSASNPCVTKKDLEKYKKLTSSTEKWDPVVPHLEFVVEEPQMGETRSYGSYVVFRKYRQDVGKFRETVKTIADKLDKTEDDIGALAIGRRRDGTSLELDLPSREKSSNNINDFDYYLEKCPAFAHVRKVNPRSSLSKDGKPQTFRNPNPIMRRGITYGTRRKVYGTLSRSILPEKEVGLLFMSFQDDIDKFQNILRQSQKPHDGLDPLLGNLDDPGKKFNHQIEGFKDPYEGFGGFVSLRGGLNLYAPSIHFFRQLQPQLIQQP